tara:strand:+ start:179 stop:349 length:171 start_codon:yes stop_codon:yes gene_type:complete
MKSLLVKILTINEKIVAIINTTIVDLNSVKKTYELKPVVVAVKYVGGTNKPINIQV